MDMPVLQYRFGQTNIAKVSGSDELREVLDDPWLESETIVIKPNWVDIDRGSFVDARTLRTLLEALDSRLVVTESLHVARSMNLLKDGMSFIVGGEEVNWRWLLKGAGWRWLIENPGWDWFRGGGHWAQIVKEDKAFLDEHGFTDLFKEFNVEYINTTDEVWNGRNADPAEVKRAVESRFGPVREERLYGMVPQRLYDLRGSTMISLARLKQYATFTLKNIFGMIIDPMRPWWHGLKNSRVSASIVDINKVYRSIFNVYGICASLYETAVANPEGEFQGAYMGRYDIVDGLGLVAFGRDPVSLDRLLLNLTEQISTQAPEVNCAPIELAEEEGLGACDDEALLESKLKVGVWFSPQL